MMKIDEGPVGLIQGFCLGLGVLYVIDQLLPMFAPIIVPVEEIAVGTISKSPILAQAQRNFGRNMNANTMRLMLRKARYPFS